MGCVFCDIVSGTVPAHVVLDEPDVVAFLDSRPVFPGHVLVVPRQHHETLPELPAPLRDAVFAVVSRLTTAVMAGLEADGAFVASNQVVSQSVPHLHVHVVPRRRKDGLRGFFWPRQKYASDEDAGSYAARIAAALSSAV